VFFRLRRAELDLEEAEHVTNYFELAADGRSMGAIAPRGNAFPQTSGRMRNRKIWKFLDPMTLEIWRAMKD